MKNKVKVFLIAMILIITGGMVPIPLASRTLATETGATDEFSELLETSYESEAPTLEVAELSSTFTSEKEIEVYLTTTRNDIEEIVISGWSGGAYSKYKTSKTATYDETREIYTVTFNLEEIVNTNTNEIENADEITYYFDACVYGTNNTMSYYNLDNVTYTATGITYSTKTTEDGTTLTINAEEDGQIAILSEGEEITENTEWVNVTEGENVMSVEPTTYQILYLAASSEEATITTVDIIETNPEASTSTYTDDETYQFTVSQTEGLNTWVSYEDTPNIYESTIQGKHGETATAVIKINTKHAGILSFDYMSSSETEFDIFTIDITGATLVANSERSNTASTNISQTGENDWKNYTGEFEIPTNGVITITLKYKKDKNVNRYEDKAAIRNLIFTPILPSNGSVEINDGDEYTNSANLKLEIYVEDATYMYITETEETPSVSASGWLPLLEETTYTLKNTEDGEKKIYVWFKNDSNAMSQEPAVDTIKLDNAAPTTDAPTVESTATEIKITLNQTDENEFELVEYGYRLAGTTAEFTWSENTASGEYQITGLTSMQEYEIKTRVSDGINDVVTSESATIKTKIPSDKIVIESSPSEKTLENVVVTITWNNEEGYTQEYSLDGVTYTTETNTTTTIEMAKNGVIYYQMNDGTYETGVQKYIVGNIDREGPTVESVGVDTPKTGKYGIGDEITIKVVWDEEIYGTTMPTLNIKFNDEVKIPLTAEYKTTNTIVYKYTIKAEDYGTLVITSLEGGEIKDSLQNIATYELPEQTGSEIFAENAAYIAATNTYYATIQNAVNAAGLKATTITVTASTELRNTVTIKENQNIVLDLNGKTISYKSEDSIVTAIENSGTLVIKDSTNTNGEVTAYSKNRSAYTIINNNTGLLTIENGKITAVSDSNSVALKSYGIYDKEAGVITLGKDDNEVLAEAPEIKATSKSSTGIKLVDANGRLYYCDGTIKGTSESLELASGATAYIMPVGYMEKIETQTEEYGIYKVSYLSNENVVELTIDGKTEKYMTLIEALSRVPSDGRLAEIKMLADDTLMEIAKIYEGQNITLDLNGYTITRNEAVNSVVYGILNNGTLTITDTSEENTGKIQAISDENIKTYAVYDYTNGNITLDKVTLFAKNEGTNEAFGLEYTGDSTSIVKIGTVKIYRDTLEKDKKYLNPINVELLEGEYLKQDLAVVDGITYKVNYGNAEPNVSLTVNDTVTYYSSVQQAVNAAPTDGTLGEIKVLDDEELYTYVDVTSTKNISIDLNGNTLLSKGETQAIKNTGDLSIKDTSENETGLIQVTSTSEAYGIKHESAKKLEINGGNVCATSSNTSSENVYGVYVNSNGATLIINGGKLKGIRNGTYIPAGMAINNSGDIQSGKVNLPEGKHLTYTIEGKYVVNYLADGEIVATLEQNGVTTNYVSIQDAVAAIVANGTLAKITMYQSESLGRTIEILEGQNIELDLNGKEIYYSASHNTIKNSGNLIINDSSDGSGKITNENKFFLYGRVINNVGKGKITINSGCIYSNNMNSSCDVNAIQNSSTGTIEINGGTITGNDGKIICNASTGTIQLNSGEILSNSGAMGISNDASGYVEMNGGSISTTTQFVINNSGTGKVNIYGGDFYSSYWDARAINNNSTGEINIYGGNINTSGSNVSCIYNNGSGKVAIYGGNISASGGQSKGIYNNSKGKIIIGTDDGTIKNEPVISGTYAIYQRVLGSEVYFYDGILKGTDTNVVYPAETKFKSNETPTEAYYLIITTDDAYLNYGKEGSYNTLSYTDVANYELSYTSGDEEIVKKCANLKSVMNEIQDNIKSKITVLNNTVEKTGISITANKNIVLDLNGKKIIFEEVTYGITNYGTLQIIDSSTEGRGSIEHYKSDGTGNAIWQSYTYGKTILGEDDGVVSTTSPRIYSTNCGIENGASTTIMYDGKLAGESTIYLNVYSTFTIVNGYDTKTITLSDGVTQELFLAKNEGISIIPRTVDWINEDVVVEINYSNTSYTNQYKINDGEWQTATLKGNLATITVSENCMIYAKSIDTDGNVIYSGEYSVTNIDKTAPTIENVSITTEDATSQTITATLSDGENGSGIKAYIVTMDTETPLDTADWIKNSEDSFSAEVNKNGTWYIYVKDNTGNVTSDAIEANNIDIEVPIVNNIEVISPSTGYYYMNEVITINANFSEEIVVNEIPTLKIKFGEGETREITFGTIGTNTITYTYTIKPEDEGELILVGYEAGEITDTVGNAYQETDVELIGSKITTGTKAYVVETNTYYTTLQEAIDSCSTETEEYTTIKLVTDNEYEGITITIAEGQKITLDLNGKALNLSVIATGINSYGDLTIIDSSVEKNGAITVSYNSGGNCFAIINQGTGKLQINDGIITIIISDRYRSSLGNHGILINGSGTFEINGGTINSLSAHENGYGLYINNSNANVIINSGEIKGRMNGIYKPDSMKINSTEEAGNGKLTIPANKYIAYRLEGDYIINYLADSEYVATLEMNGETTNYLSIHDAVYAVPADGTLGKITMHQSESLYNELTISEGKNIEIDLNGNEIYSYHTNSINNKGTLKITDSSADNTGRLAKGTEDIRVMSLYATVAVVYNTGNFTAGNIKIFANADNATNGITNAENGTTIIEDTTIKVMSSNANIKGINNTGTGTVEINGGNFISDQYGLYTSDTSTVIITGGEFKGKTLGIYIPSGMNINNTGTTVSGEVNLPVNKCITYRIEDNYIVNYLADSEYVATLEVNGEVTNYLSIYEAVAAAPTDGTYAKITMHANEALSRTIEILEGQNIEIDLNGKEIYGGFVGKTIINNGDIAINDTSEEQTGKINISTYSNETYGIYNSGSGTVNLKGGLLKVYVNTYNLACGIFNASNGTIKMSGGKLDVNTTQYLYAIYNNADGTVEITEGEITTNNNGLSGTAVYNNGTGNVIINGGRFFDTQTGITNNSTGTVEINGGEIITTKYSAINNNNAGSVIINGGLLKIVETSAAKVVNNGGDGSITINGGTLLAKGFDGIINVGDSSKSTFKFTGGTLINTTASTMYRPASKSVDLPENTYLKVSYVKSGDTYVYVGELDEAGDYEVTISGVGTAYYNTLVDAFNAVPSDGTFSIVKLLADCELTSDITVASGKYVQLDLNGHTITYQSTTKEIKAFSNQSNQTFEIIDTSAEGTGLINVEAEGYNAYGIYNYSSASKTRVISGKIQVTSIGKNAYGIYNHDGRGDAIKVEGGNISVKSEIGTSTAVSGKAYGIYNKVYGGVAITGKDTEIIATSVLNDSYGIYNENTTDIPVTIGEKDNIANISSPYIAGETAGIYVRNVNAFNLYDGSITGATGNAILHYNGNTNSAVVTDIEDNTFVYTLNNNDATETVMLLKNIQSLEVLPSQILLNDLAEECVLEISYLPTDAGGVQIQVDSLNINVASIYEVDDGVFSVRPKAEGSGEITVTATDLSGKALTQTIPVIIDITPPTTTAPSATSTGSSVTITCNQEDDNIDKNEIYYSISSDNGATWSTWSKRATINGLESDTLYLVKTKASDLLGNVSESETTEIKTKLANNSKFTFEPDTMTKENVIVTITWNDPQGTPQYFKVGEDGEWLEEVNETTSITVSENGVTIYTKLVYDGVEESDIKSATVDNIDRIAPTGTLAINEAYPRYDGYVTLNITTEDDTYAKGDNLGTVAYMYITEENLSEAPAEDDEGWIKYEGDYDAYDYYIQATDGEVAIYLWLMDKAHNTSEALVAETEFIPPVAVLFEDGELKGEYQSIKEAYDAARTGNSSASTIIVCQDTTITSTLTIANGKNIILDLNGKQVSMSLATAITNNGNLEITDSKEGGKLTNTFATTNCYTIYNNRNFKLSGGTIEGVNTTQVGNYKSFTVYNDTGYGKFEMTGGKIYAINIRGTAGEGYGAFGICNRSSYAAGPAVKLTGGTIEAVGLNYAYAYGIYHENKSNIVITETKITATSENGIGYGIYNVTTGQEVTLGADDGVIRNSGIEIYGSTYGFYRNNTGKLNFYDGTIKGSEGNSIVCQAGYITTPTNYGISKTVADGVETAKLVYDSYAPTVDSFEVSDIENSNTQVITAKGVEDYGTGIVGYQFTTTATAPTVTDTKWVSVTATNGPEEYSKTISSNGTYYFWAIDGAGNVSAETSVEVTNIKVKATGVTMGSISLEVGEEVTLVPTLTPTNAEVKSITYTSSNDGIAYVDAETGVVIGIKAGTATIKCNVLNYDGTYVSISIAASVTEPVIDIPETETAPTLETGYKQITATCNQTGDNITEIYYAISTDDFSGDIGTWQTDNVFTNLEEGKKYYVKTKIVTADGEVESISSVIVTKVYKASLEESNTVTYYESIQDAIDAANTSGVKSIVTLLSTETRDTVVTVASGKNISLDLNGNDLVMVSTADATFYGLTNKGTLEIIDSVGGGEIKASLTSTAGNYNVYGIYNDAGTLTVKGGTITGTNPESKKTYARGICNVNGAITIMGEDDGAISTELPKIVSNGIGLENYNGTMYFYDGLIIGNKDTATSGTIKVADGYYIKEIDTDSQTTAYLEEIVIDESKAMITTWNIPAGTEIKLPISSATNMNIVVDWGDGTLNQYIGTTFPTHTYADAREYEIKVQGTCASWGYNGTGIPGTTDNYYTYTQYLTKVNAWGELGATMYGFSCCSNLNYVTSDIKENSFTNLNTMRYMFFRCTSLTSIDLSKLNTSKVTDMMGVFEKATALEKVDVRGFDTSKVTNMESFVYDCTSLKDIKLGSMSATYVTTTQNMFRNCPALTHLDLSGLRLSRVTDMDNMFDGCTGLRSMLVNETFVVPTASTSIFNNNTSLQAIIITSAKPTSSQFTNAVSKVPTQTIFYVPTEKAETLYENSWAADFSEDRIDHIFELIGEENIRVNANGEFVDEGYLVADYTVDNSDEYTVYGYNVNVDGNVDTSVDGTYKLTYTLTRTYLDGTNSVTEVVDTLSRKVEVVTPNYLVDGVYYSTLAKAYEAIKGTEGTIIVRQDNVDNSRVIIEEGKIVTINTNGKTIEKVSYGLTNKGGLIISGTGTIETDTLDKLLINEGVLEVTNGTIVNNNGVAIENKTGDLTIGVQGDDVSGSAPVIQGSTYAIVSESGFDFYDGALKGQIASYDGEEPEIEVNCFMKSLVEEIDGIAYQVVMLKLKVVYPVIDFTASNGESDDSITLSWLPNDANEDYVTYEIQVLDESGKWQVLSEDATSPFVHEGLKSNTVFEYNIRVYDEIIGYSAYSYAEGFTKQIAADVNFIKDTTRPVIQNVAVTATGTTVDLNGMVSVTFETFDENYLSSETTLSADTIILKAGDEVIENASIEMTKVDISSGERFTFKLKNLDGAGELNLVVPVASIRDKAGLGILETVIPTGITVDDQKPETVSNFRAKCDDDLSMILTFEKLDESVKVVIQELDENGEWVTLSENANSPFIRPGVEDGKTYEYRAYTVSETGKESDYAYAIGYTSFAEASIIIRNDNIKPDISFAGVSPEKEFINSKDEIVITLDVTDANYNYDESDITSDDVAVTVGGVTNTDAIKTITKVTTVSGETYKIAITNITGIGDLGIAISGDSIIDKAGNGNDEKSLDDEIEIYVANGTIGDQAPTVDVDESIMTVTSNQQSVYDIVKIEYQYRESGETEFITASSNVIEDTAADTYYEVRTVVTDAVGNVQESQVTIAKTDSMDSSKITITADVETFTSGDVMVTITYGGSNFTKEYSIDGSTWYEVEDDEIVLTIKENTTVYARLADIKTNTESVSYVVDNIDKQKPTIGNVAVTPAGKANSKEMIVTGIEDVGVSGIYGYYISTEADLTAPTWVVVSGDSFTQTLKEDGTYYVWVNDNAGNVSAAKIVIVNNIVTKVTSVEVPDSIEVQVGEMINIPLTYSGEAKDITYTSDDESIVLIEPNIKQIVGVSSGDTTVKITITNYDGSTLEAEVKVIVRPVEIIAIVTSDGEEYSGDWTNKDVYVTLSANGVVPADYKEKVGEDGEWQVIDNLDVNAVNGNGEIVYSGDFSGDIYYIGYNEDGNAITAVSDMVTIKLDKTAPTIGTADKEVDTNSIIVRITGAIDVLSGISGYEIGIYSGDEVLASYAGESGDVTFKGLLSSTTYGIKYRVIDNAGNATELIDGGTATTGEIIRTVTYDYLTNGGETVSMESDTVKAGTEVNLVVFATKTGYEFKGWSKTPDGDILEKLIMPEEDITLFAIFKDETAPVVSDKDYETVDGDLDIILKAEDEGAGVKDYAVTTDEGTPTEWFDVEEDENGEIRITVPGTNKYYVWIRDINGNYTRYEQIAIKDIYAPTGTIEVSGDNVVNNLPYSRTNEVLLKVTASDNESADSDIKIAIYNEEDYLNITNYSQINFAYTYTGGTMDIDWTTTDGDGLKRIYVIFKDKAGNISMTIKEIE